LHITNLHSNSKNQCLWISSLKECEAVLIGSKQTSKSIAQDEILVASSITIESLLTCQSITDIRLERVDLALANIFQLL